MSQQNIDFGTFPDDPAADAIRTAFNKVQNNFDQLFGANANATVTSINRTPGAGITVNYPTGNVVVSANIACVQVSTSSLSIGRGSNGSSSAVITSSTQTLIVDIDPDHVYSNTFADINNGLANFNGTLTVASNAQPNVTSLGNLAQLNVVGNASFTGSNVYVSNIGNLKIMGGSAGNTIVTDGLGNLTWAAGGGGSGGAGGLDTQVQFNNNYALYGSNSFLWDNLANVLTVSPGNIVTDNINANYFFGTLANGDSNIFVDIDSNISFTANNVTTMIITKNGSNIAGYANVTGNANVGNIGATQAIIDTSANIPIIQQGNSNVTITSNSNVTTYITGNSTARFTIHDSGIVANGTANISGAVTAGGNISTYGGNGTVQANNHTVTGAATGNANVSTVTGNLGIRAIASTYTDNSAAASATIANSAIHAIAQPTLAAANTSVTFTNASTLYIANSPAAGTNSTITNPYSLYIANGSTYFGGANNFILGNLTVQGNATYYNIESFNVEDPIISLGGGPNGNTLVSNDGKDRGTALQYYTTAPVTAFMGWDNSNGEFAFGSNVVLVSEVVSYNSLGNVRGSAWIGNVEGVTANFSGNVTSLNANLGNSATANYFTGRFYGTANAAIIANTVVDNAQPNITSVGTLTSLVVTGNTTSNNFIGRLANGNSNISLIADGNINFNPIGNANLLVVTGTGINVAGTGNFTGNLSAGAYYGPLANGNSNVQIASANGDITLTAVGNTTMTVTGTGANVSGTANVSGNANVGNLGTATAVITTGNISTINSGLMQNGTSNLSIASGSNVTLAVASTARIIATSAGANVIGTLDVTGNANTGNLGTTTAIITTGNITTINSGLMQNGNSNVTITANANLTFTAKSNSTMVISDTGANITGTANVSGNANVGNLGTATAIITTGNITTINSGLMQNGNSNVTITANANISHFVTGNTTSQLTVTATGANIPGTANIVGNANVGNLGTAQVLASANITTPQFISNIATGTAPLSVQSTTRVANLSVNYANVSDFGVVTTQTTGTFYPTFVNANTTGNLAQGSNANLSFNAATGNLSTTLLSVTSNANTGNLGTTTLIATTGNITTINSGLMKNASSNITITADANITLTANANSTLVITSTGANITGTANVSGNLTAGNVIGIIAAGSNTITTTGNANVGNLGFGSGVVTGTGNITANNFIGNGASLTSLTGGNVTGAVPFATTANSVAGANVSGAVSYATIANGVAGGNVSGNVASANVSYYANVTTQTTGTWNPVFVNASPNGNYALGSNSLITANIANGAMIATTFVGNIIGNIGGILANGNSNVSIPASNGNVNITAAGVTTFVVTGTGANITGTANVSGNANVGNLGTATAVITTGNISTINSGLMQSGNSNINLTANANVAIAVTGANRLVVTSTGANITGTANVSGNANVGNIGATNGVLTNLTVSGNIDSTGNINASTIYVANIRGNITIRGNLGISGDFEQGGNIDILGGNGNATGNTIGGPVRIAGGFASANGIGGYAELIGGTSSGIGASVRASGGGGVGGGGAGGNLVMNAGTGVGTDQAGGTTVIAGGKGSGAGVPGNVAIQISTALTTGTTTQTVANVIVVTGTGANITGTANISGNANTGNLGTTTLVATTGNVTTINSGLLQNGNSNVSITANANVAIAVTGANRLVVTSTGANITGTANVSGNANVGNLGTAQVLATANITAPQLISNVAIGTAPLVVTSTTQVANLSVATAGLATYATTANAVAGANVSGQVANALVAGTVYTNAQPNITSVSSSFTGLTFAANANITQSGSLSQYTGANLVSANYISANSNIGNSLSIVGNSFFNGFTFTSGTVRSGSVLSQGIINPATISLTSASDNGGFLPPSTTYYFNIIPLEYAGGTGNGTGPASPQFSWTTFPGTSTNVIVLRWTEVLGAVGYQFWYRSTSGAATGSYYVVSASTRTFTFDTAAGTAGTFPVVNTTGLVQGRFLTAYNPDALLGTAPAIYADQTWNNSSAIFTAILANVTDFTSAASSLLIDLQVGGTSKFKVDKTGSATFGNVLIGNGLGLSSLTGANVTGTVASATSATSATNAAALLQNLSASTTVYPTFTTSSANGNASAVINPSISANLSNGAIIATTFVGNISGNLTGGTLANGNSNVRIATANGNVTIAAVGNTTLTVTGTGANVSGTANVSGNANVGNLGTATAIITTGNIGTINSGLMQLGTSNVTIASGANISHFVAGNVTSQLTVTATGANIPGTANVVGNANVGNLGTAQVLASANITTPQFISNIATETGAPFSVQSTNRVANLNVAYANVSDYSSVTTATTGNYYLNFVNAVTGNLQEYANSVFVANVANGAITATTFVGALSGAATSATTAGTVTTAAQPNITSVGTLTGLVSTGSVFANSLTASGAVTGNANVSTITGNLGIRALFSTYTDNSAIASATIANAAIHAFDAPNLAAANTGVTFTNAATMYIAGPPVANTNATITNPWALQIGNGALYLNSKATTTTVGSIGSGNSVITINVPNSQPGQAFISFRNNTASLPTFAPVAIAYAVQSTTGYGTGSLAIHTRDLTTDVGPTQRLRVSETGKITIGSTANGGILSTTAGQVLDVSGATYTDTVSAPSAINTGVFNINYIGQPTVAATNTAVTYSSAATLFVSNAPASGTNITITNPYALYVSAGNSYFGGNIIGVHANGNSNVNIPAANGNVNISAVGVANILVVTGTGANITGTANVSGNANVGNLGTATAVITTGNITTINSGLLQSGNSNINLTANANVAIAVTGANRLVVTSTGANITGTANVSGNANVGNLGTAQVLASANVTSPQLISNVAIGTAPLVVTSTTVVANLNAATAVSASTVTGNAQPNITSVGTLASVTTIGSLTFSSTGQRILGDFSNATQASRTLFQTTAVNNNTILGVIPNGAGSVAQLILYNNSDPANASTFQAISLGTEMSIRSSNIGTGIYQPMTFYTGGSERMRVDTGGNVGIGNAAPTDKLSVTGNTYVSGNITAGSYYIRSVGTAISAAGTTQATATVITKEINVVPTVATGAGVVLPTAVAGMVITITNTSANSLLVYPAVNGIINALAANAAFTHPTLATLQYIAPTTTQWYTVGATYS
jgi:hypothetical protein